MAPPRRIPTKAELLRLQRQFKTDTRIAERLGNVTPYLVSYWRRKRNVPNYSAPKFSEKDINILWERFGDDDRCGTELGVSKAAFYSWRRRYGIKSKPAFLKLEQMEFSFPGDGATRSVSSNLGTRPATHKLIFNKHNHLKANNKTKPNKSNNNKSALTTAVPDLLVVANPFAQAIFEYIADNSKPALPPESLAILLSGNGEGGQHNKGAMNRSAANGAVFEWIKKRQIRQAFSLVDGCMWDALSESGSVLPGQLVVCQRGHERFAGAIGALGWWLSDPDLVSVFETGKLDIQAPNVVRVSISGKRYAPIFATDIVLNLASNLAEHNYANTVLEYTGLTLASMPIGDRQTLCSIGSIIDVRSALTPCDTLTLRHIATLGNWSFDQISPDRDAEFVDSYQLNIESVKPMVAIKHAGIGGKAITQQSQLQLESNASSNGSNRSSANQSDNEPHKALNVTIHTAQEVERLEIDVVFIGGNPGGHYESLRKAAEALHGKKVASDVKLLIAPISQRVYLRCLKRGILRQLIESGATIMSPGMDSSTLSDFGIGPTARIATASVEPLFSSTVHVVDRYIVSPLTAAVSAVNGHLLDPRGN